MKFGAEPRKIAVLGGLLLVGGYFFYSNVISDSSDGPAHQTGPVVSHSAAVSSVLNPQPVAPRGPVVRSASRTKASEGFNPSLKRKAEDAIDPMAIDPTLRLDLLARVQSVTLDSSGRNPFQFGTAPPPPAPAVKIDVSAIKNAKNGATAPTGPTKPAAAAGPAPLNLPWKYYGYTSPRGATQKKAFFLDGEDILTATEGEVVKRKYRVVRIGVNSVVVEDTDTKSQQTLPLQEEAVG